MSSTRAISLEETTIIKPPVRQRNFSRASFDSLLKYTKTSEGVTVFGFKSVTLNQDFVDPDSFKEGIWNRSLSSNIIILDLSNVDFIEKVFIGNLLNINERLREAGAVLVIFGLNNEIKGKFRILHFLDKFVIAENEADAIAKGKEIVGEKPIQNRGLMILPQYSPVESSGKGISNDSVLSLLTPGSPIIEGDITVFQFKEDTRLASDTVNPETFCDDILSKCGDAKKIILDLRNVDFIDSDITGKLLMMYKRLKVQGKKLGVCCTDQSQIKESLIRKNFNSLFKAASDFDELVSLLNKDEEEILILA